MNTEKVLLNQIPKPKSVKGHAETPAKIFGIYSDVLEYGSNNILGTTFFSESDAEFCLNDELPILYDFIVKHGFSHLAIFETKNGFHFISFDIFKTKIELWTPFIEINSMFRSDYEYGYNWILRLGEKPNSPAPEFVYFLYNPEITNKDVSLNHVLAYESFCNLPEYVYILLEDKQNGINRKVRYLNYLTWNY